MDNLDVSNDSFFSCSSSSSSFTSADSELPLTLYDQISSLRSKFPNNFNVAHINIQSVPRHYPDLLASINSAHLDALLISESFLKPSLPSTQFALPGFVLIRNDRIGKGCGGIAIYLRSDIFYKTICASPSIYSQTAEYLFIEVTLNHVKMLLAVFYSPNMHIDYFDTLENILADFSTTYDHIILMGDFNTCLIKNDSRSQKLLTLVSSFNLLILPLQATHHFPNCNPSLLDIMIVSSPDSVMSHGQITASFSYHDLIYLSYRLCPPKKKSQSLFLRNYKGIDLESLQRDISNVDWTPIVDNTNINEKVCNFNDIILKVYNNHAPLKRVKIKRNPAPWITQDIRELMGKRDKAKQRFKRLPSENNLNRFKFLRNRCSRLCRYAKRRYFYNSLHNKNSTEMWKFLRSVGVGRSPILEYNDVKVKDLNNHFATPPMTLDPYIKSNTLLALAGIPKPHVCPLHLSLVTEEDVKKSILAISSNAVGVDGLCAKMILPVLPLLLPILTHIFNFSISSSSFPSVWKQAYIIPLPKVSNPSSLSHFRPISILPFLSKVLEHIIHSQLSLFLSSNSLLSTYQSGFRRGHSTVTALLKVTDDIRWAMDNNSLTLLVLLDFSSAFTSVDFDILLRILESINISPSAIAWFDSYLRGRSHCVRVNDTLSDWSGITTGVPQGGVLSPLLFSIFINSITSVITSNYHLYADDLQLYRHFPVGDTYNAIAAMNADLCRICEWSASFGLLVNPTKSQAIIIGSRHLRNRLEFTSLPFVCFNGVPIPFANTVKNLGVIFDHHLTWTTHIAEVSRKVYFTLHSLKCLQNFLPLKAKIALVLTLILPLLDYADACYLDATEELLNKLERLQNQCIRFIFGLKKFDHISQFRKQLKWLPIRLRRNTRLLCLLYNILHNPSSPTYLRSRFSFTHPPDKPCRSLVKTLLDCPVYNSGFYSHSFSVHVVRLWNSLPSNIRNSETLLVFKKRLRDNYFASC